MNTWPGRTVFRNVLCFALGSEDGMCGPRDEGSETTFCSDDTQSRSCRCELQIAL